MYYYVKLFYKFFIFHIFILKESLKLCLFPFNPALVRKLKIKWSFFVFNCDCKHFK